jgi:hypothetical protein
MKLQFYWMDLFGHWEPKCRSDGPTPLALIVADTGGLPYLKTLSWLDEGLRRATQVKQARSDAATWDREAYGARLTRHQATIYFLHDESCSQVVSIDSFIKVLTAWRRFIQMAPSPARTEDIEVPT